MRSLDMWKCMSVCVSLCVCCVWGGIEFLHVGFWMYGKEKKRGPDSSPVFILTALYRQLGCIYKHSY